MAGGIHRAHAPIGKFKDHATFEKLANVFGLFRGECVVKCYGGAWTEREGDWCVTFDSRNVVFPFAKVAKQMENGREDGIGVSSPSSRKCLRNALACGGGHRNRGGNFGEMSRSAVRLEPDYCKTPNSGIRTKK